MMTLISTFMSFLAGGLPKILSMLQDRQDKKHELALVAAQKERELALAERGFLAQAKVEEIKLEQIQTQMAGEERQALYAHDIELGKGASQWMINLRASVRPVVTYIFVIELVALNIAGVWYAYTTGIPFAIAMENVFSDDEMLILSSIIAFWFGTQAFNKK
jgi:uncharacterized membrane protein